MKNILKAFISWVCVITGIIVVYSLFPAPKQPRSSIHTQLYQCKEVRAFLNQYINDYVKVKNSTHKYEFRFLDNRKITIRNPDGSNSIKMFPGCECGMMKRYSETRSGNSVIISCSLHGSDPDHLLGPADVEFLDKAMADKKIYSIVTYPIIILITFLLTMFIVILANFKCIFLSKGLSSRTKTIYLLTQCVSILSLIFGLVSFHEVFALAGNCSYLEIMCFNWMTTLILCIFLYLLARKLEDHCSSQATIRMITGYKYVLWLAGLVAVSAVIMFMTGNQTGLPDFGGLRHIIYGYALFVAVPFFISALIGFIFNPLVFLISSSAEMLSFHQMVDQDTSVSKRNHPGTGK